MHWSLSPDIPIYIQIIEQLEQMIVSGMLSPGDRLLSVREFAAEAGVNPNTMQKALTELEKRAWYIPSVHLADLSPMTQ